MWGSRVKHGSNTQPSFFDNYKNIGKYVGGDSCIHPLQNNDIKTFPKSRIDIFDGYKIWDFFFFIWRNYMIKYIMNLCLNFEKRNPFSLEKVAVRALGKEGGERR